MSCNPFSLPIGFTKQPLHIFPSMKCILKSFSAILIILFLNAGCQDFPRAEDYGNPVLNRLVLLVETDNATLVNWYIKQHEGMAIDSPDINHHKTLLVHAIQSGKYHAAEALLRNGANPNSGGSDALCAAVRRGVGNPSTNGDSSRYVALLLDYGANPSSADRNGPLPLSIERESKDMACFKCLVEKGKADVKNRLQWNVFVQPYEQKPNLFGLCHGEKTKGEPNDSVTVSLLDVAYLRCRIDIMWYLVSEAGMGDWLDSICWDGKHNIMYHLRPEICTYDRSNEKYRRKIWQYYRKRNSIKRSEH